MRSRLSIVSPKPWMLGCLCVLAVLVSFTAPVSAADDALAWPAITSEMRPWVWWWWHGSAVDETNIAHELQRFHDAGLGGVQVTTIYGVKGAEAREIPYLTPKWLAMMGYTITEAHRRGMGIDTTLGSGWCFGGPTVSDEDANASVVVRTFRVGAGEKWGERFKPNTIQALMAFGPNGKSIDLTSAIGADGEVSWSAESSAGTNAWTIYAISQKPSGQKVKRAAPGGEGWMLNPAYPKAMRDWLGWFGHAMINYTGPMPDAVFQDSYEYRTDWSPDFFAQFEKFRGYKLQDELPALFGDGDDDRAARVKYDYRRTLSDIMAEDSEPIWIGSAHKNGIATIYQAHGTPGNWLDLYGDADIPETEMFHNDRSILISKFASSAAHTQGRKLTGAETGTWLKEHFTVTLGDLKNLADDMFLAGVNHIYYHGACYSPDDAAWPGWLFYASTEMNSRNSIWRDVPALNEYVARCQSILQSGQPDNDVLLYWPVADFWSNPSRLVLPMSVSATDWFENQPIGKTAHELWDHGYAFDYVSDRQLQPAKVVDDRIQMPGGKYRVIVVPPCKYMPLETFKQLLALAKNGAAIVFESQLPSDVPGLSDWPKQGEELKKRISELTFESRETPAGRVEISMAGEGRIFRGDLDAVLRVQGVVRESMSLSGLSFIRRTFNGGYHYFIANRTATNFDGWIMLGRPAASVVALDPMTGESGVKAIRQTSGITLPQVHLQLAAGQSVILRTFSHEKIQGGAWNDWKTGGQSVPISGSWHVKFIQGGPVLPADFQTPKLASWTTFPDTNTQAFSGTAIYETTFDAPGADGKHFQLDLGDVRQSARVKLNGKDYGTLFTPPFRVIVDDLKPAGNHLEVEVTSVSANRIRDLDRRGVNWKIFKDINIVNINYRPFNAADWPLTDCGLLGPVSVTPVAESIN